MSWFTELLFNAGSGGLFGMAGSLLTTWMRLREKKLDNQFQLDLMDKQFASAEAVAAWQAFSASPAALIVTCEPPGWPEAAGLHRGARLPGHWVIRLIWCWPWRRAASL